MDSNVVDDKRKSFIQQGEIYLWTATIKNGSIYCEKMDMKI